MRTGFAVAKQIKPRNVADNSEPERPDEVEGKKSLSSLKVRPATQRIVAKVAAHRNVSIEVLFEQDDVQEFFKHLLLAEMRKEEQQLQGKTKR